MILRALRMNAIGRAQGYGKCSGCGNHWNWVATKSIPCQSDGSMAMFPLCAACFEKLSAEEVIAHCCVLVTTQWEGESWEKYKEVVTQSVRFLKGLIPSPPFPSSFFQE